MCRSLFIRIYDNIYYKLWAIGCSGPCVEAQLWPDLDLKPQLKCVKPLDNLMRVDLLTFGVGSAGLLQSKLGSCVRLLIYECIIHRSVFYIIKMTTALLRSWLHTNRPACLMKSEIYFQQLIKESKQYWVQNININANFFPGTRYNDLLC